MNNERTSLLNNRNNRNLQISYCEFFTSSIRGFFLDPQLEDDVVSKGVKISLLSLSVTAILYLVSFVLVMIQVVDKGITNYSYSII